MVKLKISEFSLQGPPSGGSFSELELKSYVIKQDKGDSTTSPETIKEEYLVLMSETEYRNKMSARSGKKSNPLMITFEEHQEYQ
jgi:hypothetical protein